MPAATHEKASTSETTRFARFIATSGMSAAINIAARWLLSLHLAYETAVALAYLVGVVTPFLLARLFVFERVAGNTHAQFARFALVNVIGFTQVWLISVGLVRWVFPAVGPVWNAETLAHLIGLGSLAATSYSLHKRFSFRDTGVMKEGKPGTSTGPVAGPAGSGGSDDRPHRDARQPRFLHSGPGCGAAALGAGGPARTKSQCVLLHDAVTSGPLFPAGAQHAGQPIVGSAFRNSSDLDTDSDDGQEMTTVAGVRDNTASKRLLGT